MDMGKIYEGYSMDGIAVGFILNNRLYEYGWAPELDQPGVIENGMVIYNGRPFGRIVAEGMFLLDNVTFFQFKEISPASLEVRFQGRGIQRRVDELLKLG